MTAPPGHEPVARNLLRRGSSDTGCAGRFAETASLSAWSPVAIRSASSSSRDLSARAARRHIANANSATATQATEMRMIRVVR